MLPSWLPLWLLAIIVSLVLQMGGLAVAATMKTERFFDFLGSANFLIVAIGTWLLSADIGDPRRVAATSLLCVSRVWLMVFLTMRASDRGDARFEEAKTSCAKFAPYWIGQALWVFIVSLPVIAINDSGDSSPEMGAFGYAWAIAFAASLLTQIHSDWVKRKWVQEGRPTAFCRRGCWNCSRHPNYAGEVGMTISSFGLAAPLIYQDGSWNALAIASVLSPVFTFVILMFATGMPTAEGKNLTRYYDKAPAEYAEYRAQTPILVPWPCCGYDKVPGVLKRLCCCEWSLYELPRERASEP
eukprot:TRINITY_DN25032_c0_g1_i2.p1 TRINITY_DN25032_c0_g1~~TRINITY_DN25032_c0_g1_i2.p1  ORF type:complete len:299 (-),score=21.42 TRINITY_DN25032_c0_g1_i2:232-1128(-)